MPIIMAIFMVLILSPIIISALHFLFKNIFKNKLDDYISNVSCMVVLDNIYFNELDNTKDFYDEQDYFFYVGSKYDLGKRIIDLYNDIKLSDFLKGLFSFSPNNLLDAIETSETIYRRIKYDMFLHGR